MNIVKRIVWQSLILVAVSAGVGFLLNALSPAPLALVRVPPPPAEELWPVVTADEAQGKLDRGEALMVDARDVNEYEAGRIPGSLNLPAEDFQKSYEQVGPALPTDFPLIVYCQGGACDQSHDVLTHLQNLGYQQLLLYPGGWEEWKAMGKPIETDGGVLESAPSEKGDDHGESR